MSDWIQKARELYLYAYPLLVTDTVRKGADPNGLTHLRTFPTEKEKRIVKLNNDTLYSYCWPQLDKTPYRLHLPEITGRYVLLPILDAYTEVVETFGTHKATHGAGDYLLVYGEETPAEANENETVIHLKTALISILLRVETRGKSDYAAANQVQDSITVTPVYPERTEPVPPLPELPPAEWVNTLSAEKFFTRFAELTRVNPIQDAHILDIFEDFGYDKLHTSWHPSALSITQREALHQGKEEALRIIRGGKQNDAHLIPHRGWISIIGGVGTYGNDYVDRAITAYSGWGANRVQDSAYVTALYDDNGDPLYAQEYYQVHFAPDGYPHADIFWSITVYGEPSHFLSRNPIDRHCINSYDVAANRVHTNADGSLDLWIRSTPPGKDKLDNWLPSPQDEERFSLAIRIYTPDVTTMQGQWEPPSVTRVPPKGGDA